MRRKTGLRTTDSQIRGFLCKGSRNWDRTQLRGIQWWRWSCDSSIHVYLLKQWCLHVKPTYRCEAGERVADTNKLMQLLRPPLQSNGNQWGSEGEWISDTRMSDVGCRKEARLVVVKCWEKWRGGMKWDGLCRSRFLEAEFCGILFLVEKVRKQRSEDKKKWYQRFCVLKLK
jgi:hypothetical protein